jgi:hypothetical protein
MESYRKYKVLQRIELERRQSDDIQHEKRRILEGRRKLREDIEMRKQSIAESLDKLSHKGVLLSSLTGL